MEHVMDWASIPYFLAVARTGTLRGAAEITGSTHVTVRRHVEVLEGTYGVQLFRRTRGGLILTSAGRDLLPTIEVAEAKVLAARKRVQGLDKEETGIVRFSTSGALSYEVLSPMFARFSRAFPDIDLQVSVSYRFEDINRLETDVSLRYAEEVTDDVIARKLFRAARVPLASREYVRSHLEGAGPKGEGLVWIGSDLLDRRPEWVLNSTFPEAEVRYASQDPLQQLSFARQGMGMVDSSIYFSNVYPELIPVPGTKPRLEHNFWLLFHSELRRVTRVRRFVDFLANELIALKPLFQAGA
ncbi:MAG: LysR family transcriptional regulator [Rhodospirillales bacterium]